jgi:hypothetical protein
MVKFPRTSVGLEEEPSAEEDVAVVLRDAIRG